MPLCSDRAAPAAIDDLADGVDRHRPRLVRVAYRMLRDADEAEDLVQEAYLRWYHADRSDVRAPEAWLVAVVTRLAVDHLRRGAAGRRRVRVDPWLADRIAATPAASTVVGVPPAWPGTPPPAPDRAAEIASELAVTLLALLERLGAEERAAFLLRDVFDANYGEIAHALTRSEAAARQVVCRARARVRAGPPRSRVPREARDRLLEPFVAALSTDDRDALLAFLARAARLTAGGGGAPPDTLRAPARRRPRAILSRDARGVDA